MKSSLRAAGCAVTLSILCTTAGAQGQTSPGFAVDRFDPAEKGSDWFASDSLDLRGHVRPAVGLGVDWAYKPLVVYNADGSERAALLEHQVVLHPGASLVLFDRLRLGMDIPVALESGQSRAVAGTTYGPTDTASLGDVRLSGDVRLVGTYASPFTLAAGVAFFLPSGSRSDFTGDGTVRVEPRLLAAGTIGAHFVYAARAGIDLRPLTDSFDGVGLGTDLIFSAAAGVKTAGDRLVIGPEIYGSTILGSADGAFATKNTPLEAILGAHYAVLSDWRVGAGVGPGITRGLGAPELRALASVEWAPAARAPLADGDHDSIPDVRDACPTVAGPATDDPRTNGCPPDRDADGVPDGEDACPAVPGMRTNDPRTNGCPADADSDGVDDAHDACPRVPGLASSDPKTTGCPSDRDHDAIPDSEDACPMAPGVKTNDPRTNGCPPDRDADGIIDAEDACPDRPGARDPDPKKNGCPTAFVQGSQIKIRDPFKFRFNSTELDPAGDPILEAVLAFLKEHPELKKIRIEGHTDDVGGVAFNARLSEGRAASVRTWLVKHGIDAARLTSAGLGQTHPVDTNGTEEGRRNNRRVEFHIEEGAAP